MVVTSRTRTMEASGVAGPRGDDGAHWGTSIRRPIKPSIDPAAAPPHLQLVFLHGSNPREYGGPSPIHLGPLPPQKDVTSLE